MITQRQKIKIKEILDLKIMALREGRINFKEGLKEKDIDYLINLITEDFKKQYERMKGGFKQ